MSELADEQSDYQRHTASYEGQSETVHSIEDFVRYALPGEQDKNPKGFKLRYCLFEDCSYNNSVVTNIRRHLRSKHGIQSATTPSRTRVQSIQDLDELYLNSDNRTRQKTQNAVFSAYLNKDVVRKALVRFIVQQRLALSIVERPSFHTLVRALNPLADEIIPVSHNTIRTAILGEWCD